MTSQEMELKRKESINCLVQELRNVPPSADLYLKAHYIIAKIGLQRRAKEERLFEDEDWADPKLREDLILKVERFLDKQIK
ncbi:MAG: hypothetical protein KGD58_04870 [Candidatus Lokiarchaeota archaeon]|nr:hypothetical protein [Candidatus Lokiarchaeota archaeon]